uniref:Uncharacterized protein n=1 Tax=Esox lucius TaxID=8010 RepID=A0AAY5K2B0_ESOLU
VCSPPMASRDPLHFIIKDLIFTLAACGIVISIWGVIMLLLVYLANKDQSGGTVNLLQIRLRRKECRRRCKESQGKTST